MRFGCAFALGRGLRFVLGLAFVARVAQPSEVVEVVVVSGLVVVAVGADSGAGRDVPARFAFEGDAFAPVAYSCAGGLPPALPVLRESRSSVAAGPSAHDLLAFHLSSMRSMSAMRSARSR